MKLTQPLWFRLGFFASCVGSVALLIVGLNWINSQPKTSSLSKPVSPLGRATVAPVNVPALGYLSPQCNLVAVLQTRPLDDYAKRTNQTVPAILKSWSIPESILTYWEIIDHVAIGAIFKRDDAIPMIQAVLQFNRKPSNASEITASLGKQQWGIIALSPRWLNEMTLALESKANSIPASPQAATAEHFSSELRETILQQLSPSSWAWLVSGQEKWAELPTMKALLLLDTKKQWEPYVKPLWVLAMSLSLEPEFNVGVAVKSDSDASATSLRDQFGKRGADRPCLVGGIGNWATLDVPTEPNNLIETLQHFLKTKTP